MTLTNDIAISSNTWPYSCQGLISRTARQYPNKTALEFNGQAFTYRQLIGQANQLAGLLLARNLQPEDIVALIMDRSPDMLIAMLAIMRTGASYLPIDPEYPESFIRFMLEDSSASLVFTSRKYANRFHSSTKELYMEDCRNKLQDYSDEDPNTVIEGHSLAYTLYTSGSTGRPKGVQIEHHSLLNFLVSMQQLLGIRPGDRLLAVTTVCFDISGLELYLPLVAGAALVLADRTTAKDARLLLDMIRAEKISIMQATPSTWKLMLDAGWDTPLPLKILCGGEAMTKPLAERLTTLGQKVWNLYGPTETTIWSAIKEIKPSDKVISIGWPIANTQIYILDENLLPVAEGMAGEIYIAGEGVARGYLRRPELNTERFVINPFSKDNSSKMYRTGDLGTWLPNGQILLHGRVDAQIKIRGFRIEPGEIEAALVSYPAVKEAVIKGKDDQLIAYVILQQPASEIPMIASSLSRDLRQMLKELLPEHMIPQYVIILDKFPLTSNGKIDRNALPDPSPEVARDTTYAPPRTATEKLVAHAWSTYLSQDQIGLHDDYFDLGGSSVSGLQIMTFLEKNTGKRLPLSTLFRAPTVEKLSALLDADKPSISWEPLVLIRPGVERPPLYILQGYGMNVIGFNNIARYMHPDQPVYGFQPKGLNGIDEPHGTIEAIAMEYVEAILRVNPDGPYYLAGYSYGGVVAFEMAQQLVARGKQIGMLAIIDTYTNNMKNERGWAAALLRKVFRQFPKFRFVLKNLRKYPKPTIAYQRDFFTRKIRAFLDLFRSSRGPSTPEERIDDQYVKAYENYRMRLYDGSIDLFRVKIRLYFLDDLEYMGWRPFVSKEITIHEVPGDHSTFLLSPNDQAFAAILQRTMDEHIAK
ncbi:amino acid adenylation domain-containing protein [Flavitalea sp. BT771]|uniref:non-ribosomal peptide synthetase n=1 Tax=Flavitalea sp. BT771 TaxID=3063329 RepID=UPI0026E20A44|nr:amino acid adenylation domain-containing protein [Flavitalea sp. BT771]MDO6429754.1 amino acid adenylation domain-containing protein [Flavitalea sp. BT771]MDV6218118.1 amino acid adenylation domain-containing protein [Flavitalea sp. BT771]